MFEQDAADLFDHRRRVLTASGPYATLPNLARIGHSLPGLVRNGRVCHGGYAVHFRFDTADFDAPAVAARGRASATFLLRPDKRDAGCGQRDADGGYFSVLNFDLNLRRLCNGAIEEGDPQPAMTGRKGQPQNPMLRRLQLRENALKCLRAFIEARHIPTQVGGRISVEIHIARARPCLCWVDVSTCAPAQQKTGDQERLQETCGVEVFHDGLHGGAGYWVSTRQSIRFILGKLGVVVSCRGTWLARASKGTPSVAGGVTGDGG